MAAGRGPGLGGAEPAARAGQGWTYGKIFKDGKLYCFDARRVLVARCQGGLEAVYRVTGPVRATLSLEKGRDGRRANGNSSANANHKDAIVARWIKAASPEAPIHRCHSPEGRRCGVASPHLQPSLVGVA